MAQIQNILFPVDFSERTCNTAPFVADMMRRFGAKATLLHVVEPMPYAGYGDGVPIMLDMDALKEDAQAYLDESLLNEFAGLPVKRVVEIGNAANTITDFAAANKCDLIMMPTHGYGPFRNLLLGSVASKVLHDAKCPVWTAAHLEDSKPRFYSRSVLCAVDGSDNSLPVLRWAAAFAKETGVSLRVAHVIPGMGEWLRRTTDTDFENELRSQARTMIEKLQRSAEIDVPICVAVGEIGASIHKEAVGHNVEALIIGRGTIHQKLGRLRAHSYEIIRSSPCPVISV